MTRYTNGAEGQTPGATVTPANSAASGSAFSTAFAGTGASITYSAAAANTGALGIQMVHTDTQLCNVIWTVNPGATLNRVTARGYLVLGATAGSSVDQFVHIRNAAGNAALLGMTASGYFAVVDASGATLATSTTLYQPGTRYRLELAATPGSTTTNGIIEAAVYVGDSTTPVWSFTYAAANTGTTAYTLVRFGRGSTYLARVMNWDDLAADDALSGGFIGPGPFAVAVQATNAPPRVQVTVGSPDGSPITAVSVTRTAPDGTVATRVQPPAGPSPLILFDYESPWDVPVTYGATITYGSGATITYTGAYVTLSPPAAWLIHPTTPALSVCLDQQRFDVMGVVSIGDVTRPEIKTKHRIQGSEYQIVTKSGPRGAAQTTMQVATVTAAERAALVSATRDQTPLLVMIPAAWAWDWENGYYDVGDHGAGRIVQYGPQSRRVHTLPLERVEAPIGTQTPTWTWAGVLNGFATWGAVRAAYRTWADVLTNTRR